MSQARVADDWNRIYQTNGQQYPAEYIVRMLRGAYPNLDLRALSGQGLEAADIGFGNGRHLALLAQQGFRLAGTEISQQLVDETAAVLQAGGAEPDLRVGFNHEVPFEDGRFDLVLSWNACYYMGDSPGFAHHVEELARITKAGGTLMLSVPKASCFIYDGADIGDDGYATIRNDPFKIRNGERLWYFPDSASVRASFAPWFGEFREGSIEDDCFGLAYHWHLLVARRNDVAVSR